MLRCSVPLLKTFWRMLAVLELPAVFLFCPAGPQEEDPSWGGTKPLSSGHQQGWIVSRLSLRRELLYYSGGGGGGGWLKVLSSEN